MPDSAEVATPGRAAGSRPTSLRLAIGVLALETLALAGTAGWLGYRAAAGQATSGRGAVMVVLYTAVMAVIVGALAFALGRGRGAARSPALVLQILLVPLGGYLIALKSYAVGVPTVLAGVIGVFSLLNAATRDALERES